MLSAPAEACNQMMTYSLVLSCCCYTCCIRRKLRKMLNIRVTPMNRCLINFFFRKYWSVYVLALTFFQGGFFDDFLSHLMCCCCALVQEWREAESRGIHGMLYAEQNIFLCINLLLCICSYLQVLVPRDACIDVLAGWLSFFVLHIKDAAH